LVVPDPVGHPFRVDIAIRDPAVPPVSFAYYVRVNRLVRVDATVDHLTEIYLLPERGTNVFNRPIIRGATMTIQVPGRTISADEDLTGTSPGLEALRWTVIVRDDRACDFLGDGRPTHRLIEKVEAAGKDGPASQDGVDGVSAWWLVAGASLAALGVVSVYVRRRAR
jgi:hypothetical protein